MNPYAVGVLAALALAVVSSSPAGQEATAQVPLTDAAMESFLSKARVGSSRDTGKGVTGSLRVTLTDGTLTHDAHVQTIDQSKAQFHGTKTVEFNFRDSWQFNIAVYRLDRLIGLHLVPVSVQRSWKGDRAAFTWWVDDVMMDEGGRLKQNLAPPDTRCWNEQTHLLRMLDQLIDNSDRNLGNMLITKTWRVWAIDHTRAFRFSKTPRTPSQLTGIDRTVLARLETLDFPLLKRTFGGHINDPDIRNLLSRRDAIVSHFKASPAKIYDRRDPAEGCPEMKKAS